MTARISLVGFLALAAVHGQDPFRGRCLPEVERELNACQSGTQDVWYYTFQEKGHSELARSWAYKSRERAQRALESDRRLCQTVDRYFDHTDCQTRYGDVFCAACESDPGLDWLGTDLKNSLLKDIQLWDGTVINALLEIRRIEQTGVLLGQRPSVGKVFKDYLEQLKAARERVRALESLMTRRSRDLDVLARLFDQLTQSIERVQTSYQQVQSSPPSTGATSPVVALTDQCVAQIPNWTPSCDQAVDALFARAKKASPDEIPCLKEWRAYHNCLSAYAYGRTPNPIPHCVRPTCPIAP